MSNDYQTIATAINYLQENARHQPSLDELAEVCALSPYHFQRLFRRWAGVSPKQFLQYLTVQHARSLLEKSVPVLDTCFEVGLSGPGRLHDHIVQIEAVTPGEMKRGGGGLTLTCGTWNGPFGLLFAGISKRGICALEFLDDPSANDAISRLKQKWPGAEVRTDDEIIARRIAPVFSGSHQKKELKLLVQGTNFQVQVWQALLKIPDGHLCSYGKLATFLGKPKATRAVASAVGANPVAYLIPCHRVLRTGGEIGGYRWGTARKKAMLAWEFARPSGNFGLEVAQAAGGQD